MKKKNTVLLVALLFVGTSVYSEEFEFDEDDNEQCTHEPAPVPDSPLVELAKDVSAQVAQRALRLYLFLYDLAKNITGSEHE